MRLEEKEQFLTKKTKQLQDLTDEKSTLTGEIRDMKDMLDVKERKVNVLQKKVRESSQLEYHTVSFHSSYEVMHVIFFKVGLCSSVEFFKAVCCP